MSDLKKEKIKREKKRVTLVSPLSIREFEAFLIVLKNEGKELSVIKTAIDMRFGLTSRTKGYDYIRNLRNKNFIETLEKKIYVKENIRSEYERLILPTITDLNKSIKTLFKDYMNEVKEEEKLMEKFRSYTENILQAINNVLEDTPTKNINKKKLKKKLIDSIWRYFRAEMLKIELFSR